MATHHAQLIDDQFNRAVEIVQGLPKTGPIQTGYEEKLTMYSLYKQATLGNVRSPRPGMWDMLGRAKWDAWAKHKDLESLEAKWLYVDALMKVLRKYSEKTVARDLLQELEAFEGDPSDLVVLSHSSLSRQTTGSNSSGSVDSARRRMQVALHSHPQHPSHAHLPRNPGQEGEETTSEEETDDETDGDEPGPLPLEAQGTGQMQYTGRPPSALSSAARYRTPMANSLNSFGMSPPPHGVPHSQPLPSFDTPSAFPATATTPSARPVVANYTGSTAHLRRSPAPPGQHYSTSPQPLYGLGVAGPSSNTSIPPNPNRAYSQGHTQTPMISMQSTGGPQHILARTPLERAMESMQAHIAALNERIDMLESRGLRISSSRGAVLGGFFAAFARRGQRFDHDGRLILNGNAAPFDIAHMGLWAFLLNPLARIAVQVERLFVFLADADGDGDAATFPHHSGARRRPRSPVLTIVRRLVLDISFVLFVLGILRSVWRKSGVRRREVKAALGVLWRAIIGSSGVHVHATRERRMMDQGV